MNVMNINVEIHLTKIYYAEFYSEWLQHRSIKKWQPLIAILLILWGISVPFLIQANGAIVLQVFLIGAGVYELFEYFWTKAKWMKQRTTAELLDKKITLIFKENSIEHKGPFSKGDFTWDAIRDFKETRKGIFLIPQSGTSIYIPKVNFDSTDSIELIMRRLKK